MHPGLCGFVLGFVWTPETQTITSTARPSTLLTSLARGVSELTTTMADYMLVMILQQIMSLVGLLGQPPSGVAVQSAKH